MRLVRACRCRAAPDGGAPPSATGHKDGSSVQTPRYTTLARAKVNLTLTILGRRANGYHALESLIAFADFGDRLSLDPDAPASVLTRGPFARRLEEGPNLVATALERLRAAAPGLRMGTIGIDKRLPVAAGLGGGSADAAAALRLVRDLNPEAAAQIPWNEIALGLGADVPVCLANRTSWVTGIGETIEPVRLGCDLPVVLANPMASVPPDKTARVFRALAARPLLQSDAGCQQPCADDLASIEALIGFMRERGNDLAAPACNVVPETREVLQALNELPGARYAALSGAGPTGFALFATMDEAKRSAGSLQRASPEWWVTPALISDSVAD